MAAVVTQFDRYIAPTDAAPRRPGPFARFMDAVKRSRMRSAEQQIARMIEARGGRLTDSVEREIERSFI